MLTIVEDGIAARLVSLACTVEAAKSMTALTEQAASAWKVATEALRNSLRKDNFECVFCMILLPKK